MKTFKQGPFLETIKLQVLSSYKLHLLLFSSCFILVCILVSLFKQSFLVGFLSALIFTFVLMSSVLFSDFRTILKKHFSDVQVIEYYKDCNPHYVLQYAQQTKTLIYCSDIVSMKRYFTQRQNGVFWKEQYNITTADQEYIFWIPYMTSKKERQLCNLFQATMNQINKEYILELQKGVDSLYYNELDKQSVQKHTKKFHAMLSKGNCLKIEVDHSEPNLFTYTFRQSNRKHTSYRTSSLPFPHLYAVIQVANQNNIPLIWKRMYCESTWNTINKESFAIPY